jgi:hypothetical protein
VAKQEHATWPRMAAPAVGYGCHRWLPGMNGPGIDAAHRACARDATLASHRQSMSSPERAAHASSRTLAQCTRPNAERAAFRCGFSLQRSRATAAGGAQPRPDG